MKRNYGIDLLRMICMYFVVVLHLVGMGGLLKGTEAFSAQYYAAHFLQTASYCAVNCYALISGFVGWSRKPKLRGLLTIWLKALICCLGATAAVFLLRRDLITGVHWLNAAFPVSRQQYWYLTAYVGLFFFQPILNAAVAHLPRRELGWTLVGILAFSIVPVTKFTNLFRLSEGYSCWWLCILYLLGGFLGKYDFARRFPAKVWLLGYAGSVLLAYLPRMAALRLLPKLADLRYTTLYLQYTSPLMILGAVCLVLGFSRLEPGRRTEAVTKALAPHAFGVYLFHVQPLVFRHLLTDSLAALGTAPVYRVLGILFAAAAAVYALGTAADWVMSLGLQWSFRLADSGKKKILISRKR